MTEATALLRMLPIYESGHCVLLAIDEIIIPALNDIRKIGEKEEILTKEVNIRTHKN